MDQPGRQHARGLRDRLAATTAAARFTLELRPALPEDRAARGWTNYQVVWVGNEHGEAESLRVLAHEYAGHIRADHERRTISRGQRETEADSVAYLVLKALGFDISSSTVDYLAGWLPDDRDERAKVIRDGQPPRPSATPPLQYWARSRGPRHEERE